MTSKPIIILILLALLIVPAMAYEKTNTVPFNTEETKYNEVINASYDASMDGKAIALAQIVVPIDSQTDFTVYYGNGSTVSGSIISSYQLYTLDPPLPSRTTSTITFGGVTKTYTFTDIQPLLEMNIIGYGKDTNVTPEQTGLLVYSVDYSLFDNDLAVFYPVDNIAVNTIYRIDFNGNKPFTAIYRTGNPNDIATGASKSVTDMLLEWLALFQSVGSFIYDATVMIISWGIFFWNNLGLITALYVALTGYMAISSNKKNILKAIKVWLGYQVVLFHFIIGIPSIILGLIEKARNILKLI